MIPNFDPVVSTGLATQATNVKRVDLDRIVETYQTQNVRDSVSFEGTESSARPAEKTGTGIVATRSDAEKLKKPAARDQAEINFQMTREERDVFLGAMSGRERVSDMTENEQRLMEKAAERLERLIETAEAKDAAGRERVDKAVKEWYLRLSNGKQPPSDLLTLIRDAAAGKLD